MSDKEQGKSGEGRTPRRRRRLPILATLHLDDSIPANDHHPLARAGPERREAERLRLIASVLARLASGRMNMKRRGQ